MSIAKKPLFAHGLSGHQVIVGTLRKDTDIDRWIMQGLGKAGAETILPADYKPVEVKTSPILDSGCKLLDGPKRKIFTGWSYGSLFIVQHGDGTYHLYSRTNVSFMRISYTNWARKFKRSLIKFGLFIFGSLVAVSAIILAIVRGIAIYG
jgi:hypothetical protein